MCTHTLEGIHTIGVRSSFDLGGRHMEILLIAKLHNGRAILTGHWATRMQLDNGMA